MDKVLQALDILYWACRIYNGKGKTYMANEVIQEILSHIDRWRYNIQQEVRK
jgi:hypothetical protein